MIRTEIQLLWDAARLLRSLRQPHDTQEYQAACDALAKEIHEYLSLIIDDEKHHRKPEP